MENLSAFLKKYNCINVQIVTGGSLALKITGNYDTPYPEEPIPLSQIVYIEDFPVLLSTFNDFSAGGSARTFTHFRMELENELHWAYLCCEKTDTLSVYNGVMLDVYEYLDCIPNDRVIAEFESRQKRKISDLNSNGATLEEVVGIDYLKKVQVPLLKAGIDSSIYDENEKLICSLPEQADVIHSGRKHIIKQEIRFNYKVTGYWYIGTDSELNAQRGEIALEAFADSLSRIAHSSVLLYNETENSRAVNRQLGTNVEQQLMINNIYSVIMEESKSENALTRVLEMAARYLHVDRIAAYLPAGEERRPTLICHYETDSGKQSTLDDFVDNNYEDILNRLGMTEHYFTQDTQRFPTAMSAFAVSKISGGENGVGLLFYQVYDGERRWEYSDRRIVRSVSQVISGLILRREMDEEIEQKNRQLTQLAFFDEKLGIRNRAKLDLDLAELRDNKVSGIAMAVQIMNTRALNEVFGQSYTDKLLRAISEFLSIPEIGGESVYRFSGSIIFIVLPNETADGAQQRAQSILARFSDPFIIDDVEQFAEVSVGAAAFSPSVVKVEDLYRAVTLSLYRANEYGKNSLAFFSREFRSSASSAYHLEQELRRCIADDMRNFELVYQPVQQEDTVHHYEALLRWRSEKEGRVSPRVFIKLMEKVGLDSAIDFWVIPKACAFCRQMREQTGEDVRVSVNLTTHEMQCGVIPDAVQGALNETGLDPEALIVEVPEAAHIIAGNETVSTLGKLKKMGVGICIDSFGSDYLPLNILKYSYIDMVKLDASFVTNSGDSCDDELVKTAISFASSRGITVIVKNIQYEAQLNAARSCGIECFQGELITPPLSGKDTVQQIMCQAEAVE